MSTYYKGSLEPLATFLPVGIETLGYLLPQPGVCIDAIVMILVLALMSENADFSKLN